MSSKERNRMFFACVIQGIEFLVYLKIAFPVGPNTPAERQGGRMKNLLVMLLLCTACSTALKKQTVVCGALDSITYVDTIYETVVKFSDGRRLNLDGAPVEISLTKGKLYAFTVEDIPWLKRRHREVHLIKTSPATTCGHEKERP